MIDPSIALSYKPVQLQDPMQGYAEVQQIKAAKQDQQLRAAQLTASQQENEQRALALKDQQALRDAWAESNGDGDAFFKGAVKRAVSPQTLLTLKNTLTESKMKAASLDEATQKNTLARHTNLQSRLALIAGEKDPVKQKAAWDAAVPQAVLDGDMTPEEAQQHGHYPGPDGIKNYVAGLNFEKWTLGDQQMATAAQRRGAALKDEAALPGVVADSGQKVKGSIATRLLAAGPDNFAGELMKVAREYPALTDLPTKYDKLGLERYGMSAEQAAAADRADASAAETAKYHQGELAVRNREANISAGRAADEHAKRVFDQSALQELGESLGRGELTRLKDVTSLRGDQRLQVYAIAKKSNPNFNTSELDRKIKNEDWLANGKGAENLQSFGTFLQHAGAASDAVSAIRLGNGKLINKPLNWWRSNISGDPSYTALIGALEPVRKEAENFLLNGHAQMAEDKKAANTILSEDSSPAQIQAALKTLGHTVQARFGEMNFRYKKVSGHDIEDAISPEALAGAQKIGIKLPASPAAAAPAAPGPAAAPAAPVKLPQGAASVTAGGRTYWFATQQQADAFKAKAGVK